MSSLSKPSPHDQISTTQATVIVVNYMLGAGILTLPRTTAEAAQTPDVWLSILLSGIIAILEGVVIGALCRRYEGKTLYQFLPEIIGKWAAPVVSCCIILYFIIISAFEIRVMAEVTGLYLLEGTPFWAMIMAFMWVGLYLMVGGISCLTRVYEIILPITIVFLLITMLLSFNMFDLNNLRPVLGSGFGPVLAGIKPSLLSYTGFEIMLITTAYMKSPQKAVRATVVGIIGPMSIYVITVLFVIGGMSIYGVQTRTWPTLDLMRSYEIQGLIFERFESLLLVIWIMQIFSTFTITQFAASLGLSQLLRKNVKTILFILLPIIYLVSLVPKGMMETFELGDAIGISSIFLFGVTPLVLLIISVTRKKVQSPK